MKKLKIATVKRPWGKFEQFVHNKKCTVKVITVKAGEMLSLQSHKKRAELWYALDSGLKVVKGSRKFTLKKGQTVFINRNEKHRLIGSGKGGRILEVSFGSFNEKDEKRYEDKYGRR